MKNIISPLLFCGAVNIAPKPIYLLARIFNSYNVEIKTLHRVCGVGFVLFG